MALLAAVGTTLGLTLTGGETAADAGQGPPVIASAPVTSPPATPSPVRPTAGAAGPSAAGDAQTSVPPAQDYDTGLGSLIPTSTTPAQPPAGYTARSGRSGWSIAVPGEWSAPSQGADRVGLTAPAGYPDLLVDTQAKAGPSAIGAWRSLEGSVRASSPGYRLLSIRSADGADGATAAIWEFTFTAKGRTIHVLDLGVVRNGHGYALRWRAPEGDWSAQQALMWRIFATFRPGP